MRCATRIRLVVVSTKEPLPNYLSGIWFSKHMFCILVDLCMDDLGNERLRVHRRTTCVERDKQHSIHQRTPRVLVKDEQNQTNTHALCSTLVSVLQFSINFPTLW